MLLCNIDQGEIFGIKLDAYCVCEHVVRITDKLEAVCMLLTF